MKTKIVFGILAVMLFASCSKGGKIDLIRGINYSYNGFTLKDVITYDSYKRVMNNKKLPENSALYVEFKEIGNFSQENGKVFPGCNLQIKDKNGNVILDQKDLYASFSHGVDAANFVNPFVTVRLSDPIVGGKKYDVEIHMYDKKNPENVVDVTVEIDLSENDLKVEKTENGLTTENILLVDQESGLLPSNIVKLNSKVAILLTNTKGFTEKGSYVYPGCELIVTDKSGNVVLYNKDIYADLIDCSIDKIAQLSAIITYADPIVVNETYTVKLRLFDKADISKEITVSMNISVIN